MTTDNGDSPGEFKGQLQIQGTQSLATIERVVKHPDFQFQPEIHQNMANELYAIFKGTSQTPAGKPWSERASVMSARIIAQLHRLNLTNQQVQQQAGPQTHLHAHSLIEPDDCRAVVLEAIDAEIAERDVSAEDSPSDNGRERGNGEAPSKAS